MKRFLWQEQHLDVDLPITENTIAKTVENATHGIHSAKCTEDICVIR